MSSYLEKGFLISETWKNNIKYSTLSNFSLQSHVSYKVVNEKFLIKFYVSFYLTGLAKLVTSNYQMFLEYY